MTRTRITGIQRSWLEYLAKKVASALRDAAAGSDRIRIKTDSKIRPYETNTDGWYVDIGRVHGDRSSALELWLDFWPRGAARKLYVCYYSSRTTFVTSMAAASRAALGPFTRFGDRAWEWDQSGKTCQLRRPLPPSMFGRPIAEIYDKGGAAGFFGLYFRQTPAFRERPTAALVDRCARFLAIVSQAAIGTLTAASNHDREFAAVENRRKVTEHLRRERSPNLARLAKVRDGFTCTVCGFNFERSYGNLGKGFAEAHHKVPLSQLRSAVKNTPDQLVTVCANCQRMLHRMTGAKEDLTILKRLARSRGRAA